MATDISACYDMLCGKVEGRRMVKRYVASEEQYDGAGVFGGMGWGGVGWGGVGLGAGTGTTAPMQRRVVSKEQWMRCRGGEGHADD